MKYWKLIMVLALAPWLVVAILKVVTSTPVEALFVQVALLFSLILWPLAVLLMAAVSFGRKPVLSLS